MSPMGVISAEKHVKTNVSTILAKEKRKRIREKNKIRVESTGAKSPCPLIGLCKVISRERTV